MSAIVGSLYSPRWSFRILAALGHQLLRHRQAETRHKSSVDLALMRQRVDDGPHIMGGDHLDHLDLTGFPVHFYLSDLRAEIHDVFWLRGIVLDGHRQGKVGAVLNRLPHVRTRLQHRVTFRVGDSAGPRTSSKGVLFVGIAMQARQCHVHHPRRATSRPRQHLVDLKATALELGRQLTAFAALRDWWEPPWSS